MKRVQIFDTTLRDGEQSPGISLTPKNKLEIARQLDRLGVDVIETGFPISSSGDFEAVSLIASKVSRPVICALSRAKEEDIDVAWQAIKEAANPRIHTFVMASDIQIKKQLNKSYAEVLEMVSMAVSRAKRHVWDVEFSPMDATRANFDFLLEMIGLAIKNGATVINIPDTVGISTPDSFGQLIKYLVEAFPWLGDKVTLSVHCHNDLGMATANALVALQNGANQVECTINGLGERAGNTALEEIAMIIDTLPDLALETNVKTPEISKTSRLITNLTGYSVQHNKAIVGRNAFAHSSGIHQDGVLKSSDTYEIIKPERIGLKTNKLVLGKTSGKHAFKEYLSELEISLPEEYFKEAFRRFKKLADKKAEITEADVEAIVNEVCFSGEEVYYLVDLSVCGKDGDMPIANVVVSKNGEEKKALAEGKGHVSAIAAAINNALQINGQITDYEVKSITEGSDSQAYVICKVLVNEKTYTGSGSDEDVLKASAIAYLRAVSRALA